MKEHDLGKAIARHLNYGLTVIDEDRVARLRAARERALAAHREPAEQAVHGLAWAGAGHGHSTPGSHWPLGRLAGIALILALALAVWAVYHQRQPEVFDVDAVILAEELPIKAYLNEDFQEWLESRKAPPSSSP